MKILFWIFAILSIPAGFFTSIVCYFSQGLGLTGTVIGDIVCIAGMFSIFVSVICAVLGVIKLRKGNVKKAVAFALAGVAYSGIILAGIFIDSSVDTVLMEKDTAVRNEQLYGENWDDAPAIEGIPKLYQQELSKYYAAIRDKWPSDQLMDLGAVAMSDYYGDASLDNIGFVLMDLNGDSVNELLIGSTAPVEEGGTVIFCIYSNPENPFLNLTSTEGETYYLHSGEVDGVYVAEIGGADASWLLKAKDGESILDITYQEGVMNSADRLVLEMTPFSSYI